jgi:hypothetical protein
MLKITKLELHKRKYKLNDKYIYYKYCGYKYLLS